MVAGATYAEVRRVAVDLLGFDTYGPFYTHNYDLRCLLAEYGYTLSRYTPFKSYAPIGPLSILEIERTGENNHWVLLVKCGLDMFVLDPAQHITTTRRRDWNRLKVESYMNVKRL
ncbi:hypothetical protein DWB63_08920 [Pseudodesulfovibrio sp. S3]|nr:hypothetical protein DWB63_08920 [Pseudodesulfovibrio sp. S3]